MPDDSPTSNNDASGGTDPTRTSQSGAAEGRRIGPYKLGRVLGEGGMGIVFEAEQEEPVHRKVALKLIKPGMDSKQVVARFESERQALALMSHPNIARVLDAGTTVEGRPYFVMEYVPGLPITDYCDLHRLGTRARLDLLLQTCDAVQHAHQRGVIHRDLKPSNVLVSLDAGTAEVKVIDFGVAKAVSQRLTERTLFTELGQFVGTPAYVSPEQAGTTGEDVDTRTDVYSLGVLTYELLAGALPFEERALREVAFDEMIRQIREVEPPRPSQRLSTLADRSRAVALRHGTDAAKLIGELKGDLDWIVMKAIEKDRTRRYSTISELAADIRRHLASEPVLAGPPSVTYRARKFAYRHRFGVAAAAALLVALVAGIAGTTVALLRAVRAESQFRAEARAARDVSDFLVDLFTVPAAGGGGKSVTAGELIDRAASGVRQDRFLDKRARARLLQAVGLVYRNLGLYDRARPLLDEALSQRTALLGADHPETAESLNTCGSLLLLTGDAEGARPYFERALAIQEKSLEPDDPQLGRTLNNLANVKLGAEDFDGAQALYARAVAIRERTLGPEHPEVAKTLNNLGLALGKAGRYQEAQKVLERALAIREAALGPNHRLVATSLTNLALVLTETPDLPRARELLQRADAIFVETLGPNHPNRIEALRILAGVDRSLGDDGTAHSIEEQMLALQSERATPDPPGKPTVTQ